ncbi:MAG: DUF1761 domain-containing protein [Thermoplasmata archaeon]|nr:DUF1761 domain-containing protein [Thermoplasmata archaeon]
MASLVDTNWVAVIVTAIVAFVLGGIWYSRAVFGKAWMAALGRTEADMEAMRKKAPKGIVGGLIGAIIAAFVLSLFLNYARAANFGLPSGVVGGIVVGFLAWLGFVATGTISGAIFEGRPGKLVGINIGYSFVQFLLMGAILAYWI